MAQTKKRRKRKHRGTQGGSVDRRRRSRPRTREEARAQARRQAGQKRAAKVPTWQEAFNRALLMSGILFLLMAVAFGRDAGASALLSITMLAIYVPAGYYLEKFLYSRRLAAERKARDKQKALMDVRTFTVGPVQENCFIFRRDGSDTGLIVDPGEEADRLLAALADLGITKLEAILLTHTHFDHIGAVAPIARATGAPVYCPEIEVPVLADIMSFVPWPGFGPFESWDAEETVKGGERLELAGFEIDVLFTPGHSPGHVTYSIADEPALFSGDVLFQGSVGRTDLPGGDWPTLLESIRKLIDGHPEETAVYPGHMGITTLGAERASNPFLAELAR